MGHERVVFLRADRDCVVAGQHAVLEAVPGGGRREIGRAVGIVQAEHPAFTFTAIANQLRDLGMLDLHERRTITRQRFAHDTAQRGLDHLGVVEEVLGHIRRLTSAQGRAKSE